MALKKKPVTGMKHILPKEMEIRNYVMNMIRETYGKFGFSAIETPCVEHIENLSSKQGGENEKLIFKILKRGEKLKLDTAECEVAIEAMDKVSADELSRYTRSQEKPGEGIEKPKPGKDEQANVELKTDGTATAPNDN